jgi:hypothetical protein
MDLVASAEGLAAALVDKGFTVYPFVDSVAELPAAVVRFPSLVEHRITMRRAGRVAQPITIMVPTGAGYGDAAVELLRLTSRNPAGLDLVAALEAIPGTLVLSISNYRDLIIGENTKAIAADFNLQLSR